MAPPWPSTATAGLVAMCVSFVSTRSTASQPSPAAYLHAKMLCWTPSHCSHTANASPLGATASSGAVALSASSDSIITGSPHPSSGSAAMPPLDDAPVRARLMITNMQ